MALRILSQERFEQTTRRLLEAPDDLIAVGRARLAGSSARQSGVALHRDLFERYLTALKPVVSITWQEWSEAMKEETHRLGSKDKAREALLFEDAAGPAADMRFIGVIREFWLACDAINRTLDKADWLDPPVLLLAWLIERRETLCAEVVASQPYWPMGLSKDGQWI
ncbi:hypothetical protein [Caballeronia glebae]|uniref:hypothetical protein n=1 Tax=Caballeronia glebae TaxID=1777143 RepID=UPI0038BA1A34